MSGFSPAEAPTRPDVPTALALEANEVQAACKAIAVLPIPDQAALDSLAEGTKDVKARLKFLEASRQARTAPLLAEVETIRAEYRPVEQAYKALEVATKARLARHASEAEAARQTAQVEAGKAFQAGDQAGAFQALVAAPLPVATAGVSFRKEWAIEVTDSAAVPRHLCVPDEGAILALAKATNGQPISGVRVFQVDRVAVRTGR